MALKIKFQDDFGVQHDEAYVRISKFIIENPIEGNTNVSFDIEIYHDMRTRLDNKKPIYGPQGYSISIDKNDIDNHHISDAYGFLKSISMFSEGEDC